MSTTTNSSSSTSKSPSSVETASSWEEKYAQ